MKIDKTSLVGLILTVAGFILEIFVITQVIRHATDVSLGYATINLGGINIMLALIILGSVLGALGCLVLGLWRGKGK